MLSQEQIATNAKNVVNLINEHVKSNRKDNILKMLEKIGPQYFTAPAAQSKHSAFAGGLVHHTLKVVDNFFEICNIWGQEFNKETLVVCALFHDLGKSTTINGEDIYIVNESQWHREKLGKMYELNPVIRDGLTHAQRSVRLLSHYNVELSEDEYLAILSHDSIYVEENLCFKYKMSKLAHLLHWSDMKTCFLDGV